MNWSGKINRLGILGGTFDPPHNGHLALAEEALAQFDLDRVLWVLTPDPPHKQGRRITPLKRRLAMLQAALEGKPAFEISRVDIDRSPPHYALDTMRLLRSAHPEAELGYLMGSDSLADLPRWHRPQEFLAACDWLGVLRRRDREADLAALEHILPGVGGKVRFIQACFQEISSTEVRQRLEKGEACEDDLPPRVWAYIQKWNLYSD